ncbi:MAG TPA: glucosaminidase domain-containing protein [Chitinophagaceae bacterium]|nr:glucosaminidase domain-containing protein [Chitinophagaceae bacterium]
MQKLKILFLLFASLTLKHSFAQQDPVVVEYINAYKELAIAEMQRTGIPASIKLAQGIHETSAGTSDLVKKSNNHFGLKCKAEWTGMTVSHTDDAPNECFRKYENPKDSYKDQSNYLKNTPRYALLFDIDPTDYKAWAFGLKKAGYATNPRYSQILIKLIEDYDLQDYTMIALGKLKPGQETLAKNENKNENKNPEIIKEERPVVMPPEQEVVVYATKETKKPAVVETKPEYPEGEFKINETKVIYAKKGTSYLSIAEKYAMPLARIFEFNEMKVQESVEKDQLVYIMRKRKVGLNEQHTVKPGETLADISQTEALRIESLLEYNYLQPNMQPAVGSVLYLRSKAPGMPALATGK